MAALCRTPKALSLLQLWVVPAACHTGPLSFSNLLHPLHIYIFAARCRHAFPLQTLLSLILLVAATNAKLDAALPPCIFAAAPPAAARRQMVSFAVDQQATMVESNEKPNVTPAMLSAWVSFLFSTHDPDCVAIGERVSKVGGCFPPRIQLPGSAASFAAEGGGPSALLLPRLRQDPPPCLPACPIICPFSPSCPLAMCSAGPYFRGAASSWM